MKKNVMIAFMALSIFSAVTAGNRSASIANQFCSQEMDKVTQRVGEQGKDSIAEAIVTRSDVPVSFKNDEVNPWTISGEAVKNGNCGKSYSTSTLTMNYSSSYKTELALDWLCCDYYGSHPALCVFVDGVQKSSNTNSSYNPLRLYIEPGQHVIVFKDSIGNSTSTYNYSYIKNIQVKEITPLENAVLTEKSKPLTFENDGTWPWTIEDGYIQNSNYGTANSASKFSTTFTIDKLSKFSFSRRVGYWNGSAYTTSYDSYHYFRFKINGQQYYGCNAATSLDTISVALEPGTYTMEWQDTIYNTTSTLLTQIRSIELSDNWVNVELSSAGTLGVEVLYLVNVLKDVELLKVKGPINSTDWATIKQMSNLLALDLSEAQFETVPDNAFDGMSNVSNVKLPEGVKIIGQYAFRGTQLLNIDIPSSVTYIGQYAFYQTRVKSVNFKKDSELQYIGYYAFLGCTSLEEFIMPNTVTQLGSRNDNYNSDYDTSILSECTNLKKVHFSDALTVLEQYVCYNCRNLEEVHLPKNVTAIRDLAFYNCEKLKHIELPSTLKRIDYNAFYNCGLDSVCLPLKLSTMENYAFQECKNLKYIELPSYIGSYDYNFYGCTSVQTIVSQSATPPSISNDPFSYGSAKSTITLKVPSFAVVNYKLDKYWYQFGSIVESDDIDYWKITSPLSLTNNRRMDGKPDIDLYYGGQFMVGGNAPMETGLFNLYVSESNPGRLLNTCEAMTADSLNTYFSVNSETWYFFTPLHDVDLTKVSVSNDASYVFRYYDGNSRATNGTGNSWRNVDNGKLTAGQGYIFRCNTNAVITFPAAANVHAQVFTTSDVTKPLTAYEATASANKSWNYVGNPYPCYFDIYYMDFTAPITVWTGNTYKAYSIVDDNYALRPMQSFFVQKPDAVDNIVFHKEGRQLTSDINHVSSVRAFRAPARVNRCFFNIQLVGDEMTDETRVVVNDNASLDYEIERDASKFMSFETSVPQVFTVDASGNGYAINERPLTDGTVKLAYYAGQSGFYTISATRSDGEICLYDSQLNKTVNLGEQDYTFHSDATDGTNNTRFVLTLKVNTEETTGITTVEDDKRNKENVIYDLQGRKVQNASKGIFIQNGHKVAK
ncbi:MAG: leucine-rich repeat domain-containing protein [Prevotella sp.]|nr:leucine-rich repeat domain-containing protein [Prevotella sp.]